MEFLEIIKNPASTIGQKYMAFFDLKHLNRLDLLIEGFPYLGDSEYMRHEVVYIMGQMDPTAQGIEFLSSLLSNEEEPPVVRHEAGEALGNFPPTESITLLLKQFITSEIEEVRDTCILAVHKHETFE